MAFNSMELFFYLRTVSYMYQWPGMMYEYDYEMEDGVASWKITGYTDVVTF